MKRKDSHRKTGWLLNLALMLALAAVGVETFFIWTNVKDRNTRKENSAPEISDLKSHETSAGAANKGSLSDSSHDHWAVKPSGTGITQPSQVADSGGQNYRLGYPEAGPELNPAPHLQSFDTDTPVTHPKIALVIDDLGYRIDAEPVRGLIDSAYPVTIAIIPGLPLSPVIAHWATRMGKEVILHTPMEPDHQDGHEERVTISRNWNRKKVVEFLNRAAYSVPGAVGLNNHMGSGVTQDEDLMSIVAGWCGQRNWYVLDSITHPGTKLYSSARKLHVPAIRRDVFLDHVDDEESIRAALNQTVEIAGRTDRVLVAIGHPRPSTWRVLAVDMPRLAEEGVEWVPLSAALDR